ncbi:hypothetical protein MPRG_36230 [Mycobacterium paragordonae]|uniref:Uncharacterized protein n=1 Tax=Mycobacterium paragordonae TaxID=1389713 RepID=A0ABQ1C7P0_9MYCO|nr:hypothetical protein MPRG_36230 [Mycobacterium paragordonae]
MAGVFSPRKFVAINVESDVRLASTRAGCTVAVNAPSNADAAVRAKLAAASAWPAAAVIQSTYGNAAAAIAVDAGPAHGPLVRPTITALNDDADAARSAAKPSQADAAACSDPGPAPAKIRIELISGGNHAKSQIIATPTPANRSD